IQVQHQTHVSGPSGVAAAAAAAAAGGGANQFVATSLYVGDLDSNVTDSQLYDYFNQVGQVVSVRVCRDLSTRRSLGYGYVNYSNPQDGLSNEPLEMLLLVIADSVCWLATAIAKPYIVFVFELLKAIAVTFAWLKVMYSHRDPSVRKSGAANIFIKNLDKAIDNKALHDTFSTFGNILSCKIATDPSGQSKGYGFVQFDNDESAQTAIDKLNGMLINDKQVYVGQFLRKQERETAISRTKFNNIYVKNLAESTTEEDLEKIFGEYGTITSVVVMRDGNGKSKCFGFVNFENADDAANAVEALNGKKVDEKEWYVGKAQKKSERELELKSRFEQTAKEAVDKFQGLNLYVKNLDDSIDDDKLKELFLEFGTITSCKVMRDPSGVSRGSGFVAFSTPEEASRALAEMNGKMVVSKPLYVALAQRKEERRAKLQVTAVENFLDSTWMTITFNAGTVFPNAAGSNGTDSCSSYANVSPRCSRPRTTIILWASTSFYNSSTGWLDFVMPEHMTRKGYALEIYWTAVGLLVYCNIINSGQSLFQMLPRGRVYRYPPGRNMGDVPMPGLAGGMLSVPYDMGGMLPRDAAFGQPMPVPALATALANAPPDQQRTMLGENLYPLVDQLEHEHSAKVTGMLLEMDQTEVLHLLESPEALKAKVAEAMDVLRNVSAQQQANGPADHLASLSLNDNLVS
ncbi:hypothetical protein C3L33_09351, partial [Rhododendron williamsianum]